MLNKERRDEIIKKCYRMCTFFFLIWFYVVLQIGVSHLPITVHVYEIQCSFPGVSLKLFILIYHRMEMGIMNIYIISLIFF